MKNLFLKDDAFTITILKKASSSQIRLWKPVRQDSNGYWITVFFHNRRMCDCVLSENNFLFNVLISSECRSYAIIYTIFQIFENWINDDDDAVCF